MSQPSDKHNPVETIEFNRAVKGSPLEKYWSAIGHAEKLEEQRDAAREDARRLAAALQKCKDDRGERDKVFIHSTFALAAHEALTAKA